MIKTLTMELTPQQVVEMRGWGRDGLLRRLYYLTNNEVVLHNDQLNVDYKVLEFSWGEEAFSYKCTIEVTIDILDEIDMELQRQIKQLEVSLGDLIRKENNLCQE